MLQIFKLFRRSKKQPDISTGQSSLQKVEARFCLFLQQWASKIHRKWLYAYFLLLLSIYTLASFFAIWNAFGRSEVTLKVQSIKSPTHIGRAETPIQSRKATVNDGSSNSRLLIDYMDSIRREHPAAYDSIQHERPGLLDSLQFLQTVIK